LNELVLKLIDINSSNALLQHDKNFVVTGFRTNAYSSNFVLQNLQIVGYV